MVVKPLLISVLAVALAYSFWYSTPWLQLCYGLALFLFGLQCIEEGLHNAAGGTLERMMAKSTATPVKGMLFGMAATFIVQSSTLVSLLTIAFLSAGMIGLAGGIAVILGTNLGATSGIWLLAMAGQSIGLSPVGVPMLVFGILAGFFKGKTKPFGRVLVGVALIFLGIDAIKEGFQTVGSQLDLAAISSDGVVEIIVFSGIGLLLTVVLQSSHATLILTLAALAASQISLEQGFAIAIGSNVGSSISTAVVGMLGSERSGQRLALAHLLFNVATALLSLLLWLPLTRLVVVLGQWLNMGELLQLALFHTVFNLLGLAVFWKLQARFAERLLCWLPDKAGKDYLSVKESLNKMNARYLSKNMLRAGDTAMWAVFQETRYLGELSLEVICHLLFIPTSYLYETQSWSDEDLPLPELPLQLDAQQLYEQKIKPLYSELLDFTSKMDIDNDIRQQQLTAVHIAAMQMVEIVKNGKHLQKNMQAYLQQPESPLYRDYLRLRRHIFKTLNLFRQVIVISAQTPEWVEKIEELEKHIETIEMFRGRVMVKLRNNEIDGWQTSSLMNDSNYARRIGYGAIEILHIARFEWLSIVVDDSKVRE